MSIYLLIRYLTKNDTSLGERVISPNALIFKYTHLQSIQEP